MIDYAIKLSGIKKSFKGHEVLKNVDFQVKHGEIFALIGSNGAGKTTTIKIMSTLLKSDEGNAYICGYDVLKESEKVREAISLTGQSSAVDGILTGRENLEMIAKLRGIKEVKRTVEGLLDQFELTDVTSRKVENYSGGMKRKLDIAMSLIGQPKVIFLDEPTTGLDPKARMEVWEAVKKLAEGGTTILLTTHYLDEAEQLADKVAILHGGRIIANGTVESLKKLVPPAKIEYVEKQPTLEEIYLAIMAKEGDN